MDRGNMGSEWEQKPRVEHFSFWGMKAEYNNKWMSSALTFRPN